MKSRACEQEMFPLLSRGSLVRSQHGSSTTPEIPFAFSRPIGTGSDPFRPPLTRLTVNGLSTDLGAGKGGGGGPHRAPLPGTPTCLPRPGHVVAQQVREAEALAACVASDLVDGEAARDQQGEHANEAERTKTRVTRLSISFVASRYAGLSMST